MTMPETLKPDELVARLRAVVAEEADEYAADAAEAIGRGERPDLWEREVVIPAAWGAEAADRLEALQADLERVTAERDAALAYFDGLSFQEIDDLVARLKARATTAEAALVKARTALEWAMDEIDVLSNKLSDFAYPQGMALVRREDQHANYCEAVAAREALKTGEDNG